jgi:hypothetical protein
MLSERTIQGIQRQIVRSNTFLVSERTIEGISRRIVRSNRFSRPVGRPANRRPVGSTI